MAAFVLIPGAGGAASYWHRVVPMLEEHGHQATAVGLPGGDERAGLEVYTERVLDAIAGRRVVLVAQSLGGFTAAQVSARASLEQLVLVNAMIPNPGETAGAWWDVTGWEKARVAAAKAHGYSTTFDVETYFLHDVPKEVLEADRDEHAESKVVFSEPCRFERWPEVPTHVVVGKDDRFFPPEFQARVAKERLGLDVDEIPGGHLVALSKPRVLVARLVAHVAAVLGALAMLSACARSDRTSSRTGDAAGSGICSRFGDRCEVSPGKLGTCVARDDCNDPAGCFVCQSQH